jgi:predicted Zn finger-like uncharacterized protein
MSLITQCPACSTMFKVVSDQLRISDGWVRCGQCDEVFDANAHLSSDPLVEDEPEEERPPVSAFSPDPDWAASLKFTPEEKDDIRAEPEQPQTKVEPVLEQAGSNPDRMDDFLMQSPKALANSLGAEESVPPFSAAATSEPAWAPDANEPRYMQADRDSFVQEDTESLSFMRPVKTASSWQRTSVRVLLSLTALLLAGGLVVQVSLQERAHLAAYEPRSVPYLNLLCEVFACKVEPLRNIEGVVIDGSSFSKLGPDLYRLHAVIKNNGRVPLASPALELTLTDLQDQSLRRRVFTPQDLGFNVGVLRPGEEFALNLPIAVKTLNPNERVSGYRLLAFYP